MQRRRHRRRWESVFSDLNWHNNCSNSVKEWEDLGAEILYMRRLITAMWYLQPGILLQVFFLHLSTTRPCLTKEDSQAPCKVRPISYTLRPVTTFRILHKPSEVFTTPIQNLGRPSEVSLLRPLNCSLNQRRQDLHFALPTSAIYHIQNGWSTTHGVLTTYLRHLEFDTGRS